MKLGGSRSKARPGQGPKHSLCKMSRQASWCGGAPPSLHKKAWLRPIPDAHGRLGLRYGKTQSGGLLEARRSFFRLPASPFPRSRARAAHRWNGRRLANALGAPDPAR